MAWAARRWINTTQRKPEDRLDSRQRGYDAKWRKARLVHLAEHPLCVACQERGIVKAATDVDHIVPHRGDQALFWDANNWQSLCHVCHSRKTASGA